MLEVIRIIRLPEPQSNCRSFEPTNKEHHAVASVVSTQVINHRDTENTETHRDDDERGGRVHRFH